ncbi:hypothetical protein AAAC51_25640 [Priestia megaterium]
MSKQGTQKKNQTREQVEKQDKRNDVELGNEFQTGNTSSQSQKKSGRQVNKNKFNLSRIIKNLSSNV